MRRLHFHEQKKISLNCGAIEVLQDKISSGKKNGRTEMKRPIRPKSENPTQGWFK